MQKIRIIPTILFNEENIVKGKKFESWRKVGSLYQAIKIYNLREVDELIFLDINSTKKGNIGYKLIDDFADECFMPLTIGGGIKNIENIEMLLRSGADKVCINTAAFNDRNFITEAIKIFGTSTICIQIETLKIDDTYKIYTDSGRTEVNKDTFDWIKEVQDMGVGEIILTSINNEGAGKGFDINLYEKASKITSIPLLAHGGAKTQDDVYEVFSKANVDGVIIASAFHFNYYKELLDKKEIPLTGSTNFLKDKNTYSISFKIKKLKEYLKLKDIEVR